MGFEISTVESEPPRIIEFPKDIETVKAAQDKHKEYTLRPNNPEYQDPESQLDTQFKIAVFREYLLFGDFDVENARGRMVEGEKMSEEYARDNHYFNNACSVLENYVKAGGKGTEGGTGFGAERSE